MSHLRIRPVKNKERYYYINGIIYRYKGDQTQLTLEKNAEVVLDQDGRILKNRGTVDLKLLEAAIYAKVSREGTIEESERLFIGLLEIIFIELTSENIDLYTDKMFAMQRNHAACIKAFEKKEK